MGSQIDRIHILQKRVIQHISKSIFRANTEPLFKVIEKCAKNFNGYSRLALNNHESNIDC